LSALTILPLSSIFLQHLLPAQFRNAGTRYKSPQVDEERPSLGKDGRKEGRAVRTKEG